MPQKNPQEICEDKLLALGFFKEEEKGDRCVFVKRHEGKVVAKVTTEKDILVSADNIPRDANGEYIFYRRINRVKHGRVVTF